MFKREKVQKLWEWLIKSDVGEGMILSKTFVLFKFD